MNTQAKAISKAMGSGNYGGSDSRALLAGNHASAEAARAARLLNAQAEDILARFTVQVIGDAMCFSNPLDAHDFGTVIGRFAEDGTLTVHGGVSKFGAFDKAAYEQAARIRVARNAAGREAEQQARQQMADEERGLA